MSSSITRPLPLHDLHAQSSAKFGHFGEWEVPLYYTTILEEHEAVRTRAGLFDISHMGKFYFEGSQVVAFLDHLLCRSIKDMKSGQALYMPLLNDQGGFVDDIIVYRIEAQRFYMIVNASNTQKDYDWIKAHLKSYDVILKDLSPDYGLIALQGPLAPKILDAAFPGNHFSDLRYYFFKEWSAAGVPAGGPFGMVARTGYTGEDGYEIMVNLKSLPQVWKQIMETGKKDGLVPVGFGARDTLRLEAGMPLYGHDMDDKVSPLEAGVGWAVDFKKDPFIGREALTRQQQKGPARRLIGFEMVDRGIPRQDYEIWISGKAAGKVTSGSFSPTLKKNIGLGYVPVESALPETEIAILIRDKALKAKVVKLPFYKRQRVASSV